MDHLTFFGLPLNAQFPIDLYLMSWRQHPITEV